MPDEAGMTDQPGVLLINLGTPDAPTPEAVRRYLREFLSDRRVVDLPRALWYPILFGLILPFRPARVARNYARIWQPDGSPLLAISQRLAAAVARQAGMPVALGMRYGRPSLADALGRLEAQGVRRLAVIPLYPQYSGTTTASALDGVGTALAGRTWQPAVRILDHYHDDPAYLEALRTSVIDHWQAHGRADRLLISFHGIPQRYVESGDPYADQCRATAERLAGLLGLPPDAWTLCFQSRIGRARWTGPYTEDVLRELPARGVRSVDVLCPGFAVDCLETIEEIGIRGRETFEGAGGESLRYIPALNDGPAHAAALAARAADLLRE